MLYGAKLGDFISDRVVEVRGKANEPQSIAMATTNAQVLVH